MGTYGMYCCIAANVFNQEADDTNHVAGSGLNVIQRNPVPKNINATVISTEILNPAKIIYVKISSASILRYPFHCYTK